MEVIDSERREPGRYEPTFGYYCGNCRGELAIYWCTEGSDGNLWSEPYCEACSVTHRHAGDGHCAINP